MRGPRRLGYLGPVPDQETLPLNLFPPRDYWEQDGIVMRILWATALAAALASDPLQGLRRPDFSGTWVLNVRKSNFAQAQPPDSAVLTIVHREPRLALATIQRISKVETTRRMNLNSDGRETPNVVSTSYGDKNTVSISKWEGAHLVTTYDLPHNGSVDSYRDVWELSQDGRTMIILRRLEVTNLLGSKDQYLIRMVYDKR